MDKFVHDFDDCANACRLNGDCASFAYVNYPHYLIDGYCLLFNVPDLNDWLDVYIAGIPTLVKEESSILSLEILEMYLNFFVVGRKCDSVERCVDHGKKNPLRQQGTSYGCCSTV